VLATRKQNWGEDRVMFYDTKGRFRSLLASWTNIDQPDVFTKIAAGKSSLRPDDLVALAGLIDEVEHGYRGRSGVK
jgi:hypothetical protein